MEEYIIEINSLKKQYKLGTINGGTLTADLQSWWARKRGKEDPNSKIGMEVQNGKFWALDGVDIKVKRGEKVGIIGANGAGKSTLLKILSRVTAPTEGTVVIDGKVSSLLEVGTGFHQELTGRENIYLNGAILGMSKKEVAGKIDKIIEFSECSKFIDTPVKRYSSGMYVKLAFAVAANLDADVLIMDEVLAVGDMKFQDKCLNKMSDVSDEEGKTILYVSHNMNTIRQLCDRCIVLSHGKMLYDGAVEKAIEIYMDDDKKELVSVYDLQKTKRPSLEHGSILHVNKFEFLEKEKPIYSSDEKIKFRITWRSSEKLEKLRLYFAIICVDSTIAGMTQSGEIADISAGEEQSFELEFDPGNLVEGMYYFYIDVFTMNEYGTHYSYDHPNQKIYFEIEKGKTVESINWIRRAWGNVRLSPLVRKG